MFRRLRRLRGVPERPGVTGIERWHRNQRFCETEDGTSEESLIGRPGGPSGTPGLLSNLSDKGMSYVWTTLWNCNRRPVPLVPPVRSQTEIPSKPPCDGRNRRPASGSAGRNGEETARRHRPRGELRILRKSLNSGVALCYEGGVRARTCRAGDPQLGVTFTTEQRARYRRVSECGQ